MNVTILLLRLRCRCALGQTLRRRDGYECPASPPSHPPQTNPLNNSSTSLCVIFPSSPPCSVIAIVTSCISSLLHVPILILFPVVWQECTPAHRTRVWAVAPRVEPSGPYTAAHSMKVAGKDAFYGPYRWSCNPRCPIPGVLSGVRCCSMSFLNRLGDIISTRRPASTLISFLQCCHKLFPTYTLD